MFYDSYLILKHCYSLLTISEYKMPKQNFHKLLAVIFTTFAFKFLLN